MARVDEARCPVLAQVGLQRLTIQWLVVDGQSLAAATLEQLFAVMADDRGRHTMARIEQQLRVAARRQHPSFLDVCLGVADDDEREHVDRLLREIRERRDGL